MALLKDLKPELYTPEAITRKKEMFSEIYSLSFLFRAHLMHCSKASGGCDSCKNLASLINILLDKELKTGEKTDFVELKKGFKLESLIFSKEGKLSS